jgi:hypothetical protein
MAGRLGGSGRMSAVRGPCLSCRLSRTTSRSCMLRASPGRSGCRLCGRTSDFVTLFPLSEFGCFLSFPPSKRSSVIHTVFACSVSSHRLRWILDTLRRIAHVFFVVHFVCNVLSIISLSFHATSHIALTCLYPLSLSSICYLTSHICLVHIPQFNSLFKSEMKIGSCERSDAARPFSRLSSL